MGIVLGIIGGAFLAVVGGIGAFLYGFFKSGSPIG